MQTNFAIPLVSNMIINNCYEKSSPEERFNTIQLVYTRTLEALEAIKDLNLSLFDGLVGDRAGQIRALKILYLSRKDYNSELNVLRERLQNLRIIKTFIQRYGQILIVKRGNLHRQYQQKILDNLEDEVKIREIKKKEFKAFDIKISNKKRAFFEICSNILIEKDISVSKDILFIAKNYFLTLTKTSKQIGNNYKNGINIKLIKIKNLNCGVSIGGDTFNAMKESVAISSVDFVKELAKKINYPNNLLEVRLLDRMQLPFLYMTQNIFIDAVKANIPILLKIKNIKEKVFDCKILFNKNENESCGIIIEAFSNKKSEDLNSENFKNQLIDEGILNIITYNAAQHDQYIGCTNFDANQEAMKEIAIKKGYSFNNPLLCCIEHIFSDRIINQMKGKK